MDFTEVDNVKTVNKYFGRDEDEDEGWHIQLEGGISHFLRSGIPVEERTDYYRFYIFRIRKDSPEILELKETDNNLLTNHPDFMDRDELCMRFYSKFSSPMVKSANKS